MNAYLLNWNPEHFDWEAADLAGDIQTVSKTGSLKMRWSCGKLKRIVKGDRIFLIRLGVEPKGIVASGYAWSKPYEDTKWNDPKKKALYIEINFDRILDAENNDILRLDYLKKISYHWTIQTAASIPKNVLKSLEDSWAEISQSPTLYPNEVIDDKSIFEGTLTKVLVNSYERNPEARRLCVEHYGHKCAVCNFNFEEKYGKLGKNFIHVHHVKPLNSIRKAYAVDPIKDLIPVCPNCHAMLHRGKETLSIAVLKKMLRSR